MKLNLVLSSTLETIKKVGDEWQVRSKRKNKLLGTHDTKKQALAQLAAIEIDKAKRGEK